MYERSYMHKEAISSILASQKYDFIFTSSVDGILKFWKKTASGIEFVKTIKAHMGKMSCVTLSSNETRLATVSSLDKGMKIIDVINFDIMNKVALKFTPDLCEFINKNEDFQSIIAVSEFE
mmetsp:Transcript_6885/g.6080  ORF Transcript_6885/g.6080 Transcript_6885/m.6080 type:complete len:121 (+) Transcript_6885:177-539(+)